MITIDLNIRKIKNTPYRIVFSNYRRIGMFHGEQFVSEDNLTPEMRHTADLAHAATLTERLDEVANDERVG